jgi:Protein of unknown function (DUF3738)
MGTRLSSRKHHVIVLGGLCVLLTTQVAAQNETPRALVFDVASVKINRSGLPGGLSQIHPGGRFSVTNETLKQIIVDAYGIESFRVLGGPRWVANDRFDIDGRAGRDVPREQLLAMLRALLADRFRLVTRLEIGTPGLSCGGFAMPRYARH